MKLLHRKVLYKVSMITLAITLFCYRLIAQSFQTGVNGAVVSASQIADEVGIQILKEGGNAVDAAVAVGFALAVVFPEAGNIGGGGFMLIRLPDDKSTVIDYRETAPGKASRDMFLSESGNPVANLSTVGPLAAGVPGAVRGYELAWKKYGSLPWRRLVEPAVKLARDGFPVSPAIHNGLKSVRKEMQKCPAAMAMFYPDGKVPAAGQVLKLPELANTLERIARYGADEFYTGETALQLAKSVQQGGGIITTDDLKNYRAVERTPLVFNYRGYEIIAPPPPSSGGVCLAQILKIVEHFPLAEYGFQSPLTVQVMTEAERRAYANRAHFLGDPDQVSMPVELLTGDSLIAVLAAEISLEKATPSRNVNHVVFQESEETTHYSIVDKNGLAVSNTTTLNGSYGACFVAAGTGILLNNEMDDFSIKPGVPNMYGLLGSEANAIAPGKRMLSSMTPTIVTHGDSLYWVIGTPGGGTIITSVAQVIVNLIDFKMPLTEAVNAPRFHHQWWPDEIQSEREAFSPDLKEQLAARGYIIIERGKIGDVNAIAVDNLNGKITGVPDGRRESAAVCY